MTTDRQKREEKFYVERAAELLNQTWCIQKHTESPDFLIKDDHGCFGLEVTNIFKGDTTERGSVQKGPENQRGKKLSEFQKEYEEKTETKIHLRIYIQEYLWEKNGTIKDEYFREILKILYDMKLPSKDYGYSENTKLDDGTFFQITKGDRLPWKLINDSGGWVGTAPEDQIIRVINKKAQKLCKYRTNSDQRDIRLLIVAERLKNSGKLLFQENYEICLGGFTKVYLLSHPDQIVELSPPHRPLNTGSRFSRNACIPSAWSSEVMATVYWSISM
ncbi:MAG: hypothetical protein K9G33_15865 [Sneathiella sp.]|nr:hypothetical protein [Sneathiella sp.]